MNTLNLQQNRKSRILFDFNLLKASLNEGVSTEKSVTFVVYFATDGDGKLLPVTSDAVENRLDRIEGSSTGLGNFKVSFGEVESEETEFYFYENYVNSLKDIHDNAMRRLGGQYVKIGGKKVKGY